MFNKLNILHKYVKIDKTSLILAEKDILLVDEATSNLDVKNSGSDNS
ncbi:hypothetical protein [Ligilactobacillus hayakitensis]|nr:hypothetical protein [Ligilactobacillus hayakitensis]